MPKKVEEKPSTPEEFQVHMALHQENRIISVKTEVIVNGEPILVGTQTPKKTFPGVNPMGAPRQTQRDRWKKRPVILRYHAYRDELRIKARGWSPSDHSMWLAFLMPMPKSWTLSKQSRMAYKPHQQKPDVDNLEKGFLDAFGEDKKIWDCHASKLWVPEGEEGILVF